MRIMSVCVYIFDDGVSKFRIIMCWLFFFFKQKTAYEMRISDWSSDVCSSDLGCGIAVEPENPARMADAIEQLTADPALYARCAAQALMKAVTQWDRHAVLDRFEQHLTALATGSEKFTPQTGMTGR